MIGQKSQQLRSLLIKEGIVLGAMCAGLLVVAIGLSLYKDSVLEQENRLLAQNGALRVSKQTLQNQLNKAKDSLNLYNAVNEKEKKDGPINRELANQKLKEYQDRFKLSRLDITIPPFVPIKNNALSSETVEVLSSHVRLEVSGLTDEYLLQFLGTMMQEFPGYIRVKRINLRRDSKFDAAMANTMQDGNVRPLVSGTYEFYWLDFHYKPKSADGASGVAPQPAGM